MVQDQGVQLRLWQLSIADMGSRTLDLLSLVATPNGICRVSIRDVGGSGVVAI
jgi:hypothetical protein